MQKGTLAKIALTAVVVVGGGGFLVYSSVDHAQHYEMVDALIAGGLTHWGDTELKIHGFVQAGTIVETVVDQQMQRSFILEKDGKKIRVFSKGPKPDTFKDQSEVVASGHLVPAKQDQALAASLCKEAKPGCPIQADDVQSYVFESTELMAKCPSHYADAPKLDTQFK
jgi:cytochrome c-type biogenesis protein CcmE